MDVKETGCEDMNCICLAQDRIQWKALLNVVMNLWVQ